MSQQNSNNENVEYDDLSNGSSTSGWDMEELPADGSVSGFDSASGTEAPGMEAPGIPEDTASPNPAEFTDANQAPVFEPTPKEIVYRKPRFDLYAMLLFISWFALLGAIAILWFECDPSEYGDPPYKESSRPVVSTPG